MASMVVVASLLFLGILGRWQMTCVAKTISLEKLDNAFNAQKVLHSLFFIYEKLRQMGVKSFTK